MYAIFALTIMNKYLLCIGSNFDREHNMDRCRKQLSTLYPKSLFSEVVETEAFGEGYVADFFNQIVVIETDEELAVVDRNLTEIELALGRLPDDKSKGIVKIDADLLAQNNIIVKPDDFKRPYILKLLAKIDYPTLVLDVIQ